jgi:hypothetical protein
MIGFGYDDTIDIGQDLLGIGNRNPKVNFPIIVLLVLLAIACWQSIFQFVIFKPNTPAWLA